SALAFACQQFGIEAKVYMVKASFDQKPYRKSMMETFGGTVTASPSSETNAGRTILGQDSESPGSLGIAISEAVEVAAGDPNSKYSLGSVLNHVLMHQTIIGQEAILQMEMADAYPDIVIGCAGGGSNLAGISFPFVANNLAGKTNTRFIAVEPEASPSLTKGNFLYDFGDAIGMTPLLKMHTLGHSFIPNPIHAGGLRYHGMAPLISALFEAGVYEARAYHQTTCFEAAVLFASTEGIIPAPEPTHALKAAIDEALVAKETGEEKNILFHLCGHGHLDLSAYDSYFSGDMLDYALPQEEITEAMRSVPDLG
ncbi:MAG: TrpB-like pyridoxal phosphate-dependent enzyme, partial [Pseudomonadales bacterium]|nr:TrpB-like pyridoxal phosphate-dependent enzyme [Pseudomonadales bacterium]